MTNSTNDEPHDEPHDYPNDKPHNEPHNEPHDIHHVQTLSSSTTVLEPVDSLLDKRGGLGEDDDNDVVLWLRLTSEDFIFAALILCERYHHSKGAATSNNTFL